jgi:hypothetical protein
MGTVVSSLLIAAIVLVLGAGAVIYAGLYDVAATAPHWPRPRALVTIRDAVQELADKCDGDDRPECPILRDLEGTAALPAK